MWSITGGKSMHRATLRLSQGSLFTRLATHHGQKIIKPGLARTTASSMTPTTVSKMACFSSSAIARAPSASGSQNTRSESAAAKTMMTWVGSYGAGGIDLRSDTMTTPTPSMLAAIQSCSLLDDVFREDPTTNNLEAFCANLTGKEDALFVLSGTMGNQLALRSLLTQPPHGVLCDSRAHIANYEAGGVSSLTGATLQTVTPSNGIHLTLQDIQASITLSNDIHSCPTRVISLENTLNGMILPLSEAQRISSFARQHGLKLHCDGARLWEAVAAGAGSLVDYAACFDTVSLCFSKGLGAPVGSILVGSKETIAHARWMRKAIGGGLRQPGVLTAAARVAVEETFGKGPNGEGGLLKNVHELAKQVAGMWTTLGGRLVYPVHTNMVWLDLKSAGCSDERFAELGQQEGLKMWDGRLVLHYQIWQNRHHVVPRLQKIFKRVFEERTKEVDESSGSKSPYQGQESDAQGQASPYRTH